MLAGDLSTMALADVFQWLDATRARALVTVERPDDSEVWVVVDERLVVAVSRPPARGQLAVDGPPDKPGPAVQASAREMLLDLFLMSEGKFSLREDVTTPDPGVPLEMPLQFLVMEGLRHLDEWPRLAETYPDDRARLGATEKEPDALDVVERAIHQMSFEAPTLAEVRLVLGLSRQALLRRVDELRLRGFLEVEGIPHGPDLEGSLVEQAQILLRERQYAEAAHVFRSLLSSNPQDPRARRLLAETERLEAEAAYQRVNPTDVVIVLDRSPAGYRLRGADQAVIDCLARPRSVSVLVLVSPLRELETLNALQRLLDAGVVALEPAD